MRKVKYSELEAGMKLYNVNKDFACLTYQGLYVVRFRSPIDGYYINCQYGTHNLDILQLSDGTLSGFELVEDLEDVAKLQIANQ